MRVRMNVDMSYYPDGINLKHVKQGDVEDVPPHVASVWLADGRAREDKMLDAAPATKAGPQRGEQAHRSGPNVTLVVKQGSSPYPVPPPGNVVPVKLKPAKKR